MMIIMVHGTYHHAVQYTKIRCLHPCVSCLVMTLGTKTKCRYFSKLYANNCVWKNVKIKNKIKYRTSSTSWSYIVDKVC